MLKYSAMYVCSFREEREITKLEYSMNQGSSLAPRLGRNRSVIANTILLNASKSKMIDEEGHSYSAYEHQINGDETMRDIENMRNQLHESQQKMKRNYSVG